MNERVSDPYPEIAVSRFQEKCMPEPNSGCWIWMGSIATCRNPRLGGYARVKINKQVMNASRVSYEMHHRTEIPHGMFVLHSCDNPSCVNPDHLRLGTRSENMKEMYARGRHRRGPGARS